MSSLEAPRTGRAWQERVSCRAVLAANKLMLTQRRRYFTLILLLAGAAGAGAQSRPPTGKHRDPSSARRRPARPHDARGKGRAAPRHLGPESEDPGRGGAIRAREGQGAHRRRHRTDLPAERDRRTRRGPAGRVNPRARRVRQRRAEVGDREHAARHSGHVPRRGAARPGGAAGHALPHPDRPRETWDPALVER